MPKLQRFMVGPAIVSEWLGWMRDVQAAAERLLGEEALEPSSAEEADLIRVKSALYARALTIFRTLIVLVEHDRQFDLRIHSRALVEAALYLSALDADPSLLVRMQEDDLKSRVERAKLHRKAVGPGSGSARLLDAFLAENGGRLKYVDVGKLSGKHDFTRLYASYRDVSGDSVHVSLTSLQLHVHDDAEDGVTRLIVDPALDGVVLAKTLLDAGLSIIVATYMLLKCKDRTAIWEEFEDLVSRFHKLQALRPAQNDRV